MNLLKDIDTIHWIFIGAFLALYALLIGKTILSAIKLRSSFRHIFIKFFIRTLYFSLIIIAILSPTFGGIKKEVKNNSKDIFIAIDLTESMNCKDVVPSRLDKAKIELVKLIAHLQNDKVGLIIFTSKAYLHCPLTTDYNSLLTFLNTVKTGLLKYSYTDLSAPLSFCLQKFVGDGTSNAKVLLLVSDGEDFGPSYEELEHEMTQQQISVITLEIGTKEGSEIPKNDRYKLDKSGNKVISHLNSARLEEIAGKCNGKYFEISNTEQQTTQLIEYIDTMESTGAAHHSMVQVRANKYIYFLFLAFMLMIIDVLINVKIIRL